MIDFKELGVDGIQFEQLVREIFIRKNFDVHWTGVGTDGGRDLVVTEISKGSLAPFQRKWLVSCKHKAHSKNSVIMNDITDFIGACVAVSANGFLLVTSTQPASSVVTRFEEIEKGGALLVRYWDAIELEKQLRTPMTLPLVHLFMPKSAKAIGWTIYNTFSPSLWAANYKDYFVYLSSRMAHSFPSLDEAAMLIQCIENIKMPPGKDWNNHYLRPRLVNYDDKHCHYTVHLDYLYPEGREDDVIIPDRLEKLLSHQESNLKGDWNATNWDIKYQATRQISDSFHLDHTMYYEPHVGSFNAVMYR